jgi:uncharacterized protein (DUF433 family)
MATEVFPRITVDAGIRFGKPCIAGTRIGVSDILDLFAHGADRAEILEDFPSLTDGDITAALAYSARMLENKLAFAAE